MGLLVTFFILIIHNGVGGIFSDILHPFDTLSLSLPLSPTSLVIVDRKVLQKMHFKKWKNKSDC